MKIIEAHDNTRWITAIICGRWVQAKVYDEPSIHGINDGRISKLIVGKSDQCKLYQNFHNQMCFSYDRGISFDNAPDGLINSIVYELEQLPKD